MRCTSPRTVGFKADGKTICWSPKEHSKEFATFQLPCGKCIECRLDYARQWAVRCVHEAQMHEKNAFITLTYDDEHLSSPKLIYSDFQKFMKKLRKLQNEPIGVFVTGEYGEKTKRPHWHAILFNWSPSDGVYKYSNDRGDRVFSSETLTKLWGKGTAEYGSVTFHSAGYCARYAAKKLVHGKDGEHEFEPISKKSSKHAIGKKWLEKHWRDFVNVGGIVLPDGSVTSVPRYYEKWLKENQPDAWLDYVTTTKLDKVCLAQAKADKLQREYFENLWSRPMWKKNPLTPAQKRKKIIESRFELLQKHLKL